MKSQRLLFAIFLTATFILATTAAWGGPTGPISGEGFVTSVDRKEHSIVIDGRKYLLSPRLKFHGFAKNASNHPFPMKGDAVVFRLDPKETSATIIEIWVQQE